MEKIYKRILEINELSGDQISPLRVLAKNTEEVGELSQAISHLNGFKVNDIPKEDIMANILEEGVDSLVCILSLLGLYGFTMDDIKNTFPVKLDKWERKTKERNLKNENNKG